MLAITESASWGQWEGALSSGAPRLSAVGWVGVDERAIFWADRTPSFECRIRIDSGGIDVDHGLHRLPGVVHEARAIAVSGVRRNIKSFFTMPQHICLFSPVGLWIVDGIAM